MFDRNNNLLRKKKKKKRKKVYRKGSFFLTRKYFQRKQANHFQLEVPESKACIAELTPLLISKQLPASLHQGGGGR